LASITDAKADWQLPDLLERFHYRRRARESGGNQAMTPAIKMLIGDWHVDELGMLTREITAHDEPTGCAVEHRWNNRLRLSGARAEFVLSDLNYSSFAALAR
jgi:hypothetical protein